MNKSIVVAFLTAHLIWFYFWIIPKAGHTISNKCKDNWYCARLLRQSIFGYHSDLADGQWREFRESLWLLVLSAFLVSFISQITQSFDNRKVTSYSRVFVALIILYVQHGAHSLIIISIALIGYATTKYFAKNSFKAVIMWVLAISILLFKESYRIKHIQGFHFLLPFFDRRYGGMYGWQLPANFLVLRIISYCFDYYWRKPCKPDSCGIDAAAKSSETRNYSNNKDKVVDINNPSTLMELALIESDYDLLHYCAYIFYAPLYMAGPIITYNDYIRYTISPQRPNIELFYYAVRWIGCLLLMEYLTVQYPFFAVLTASSTMIPLLTTTELAIVCYVTLKLMWLKFLILWRFFRLWAWTDGTKAPENMTKCMSNNYSLEEFWRGWHTSFNIWLVKYIYKPIGGRDQKLLSVWVIFLFVALWHDLELKLIYWGLLNATFFVIESTVKSTVQSSGLLPALPWMLREALCATAGAVYILVLIAVNLIGYAVGVGGIAMIANKLGNWEGFYTLCGSLYFLFIGVLVMRYIKGDSYIFKHDLVK